MTEFSPHLKSSLAALVGSGGCNEMEDLVAASSDLAALTTRVTTAEADIVVLDGRVDTAETTIASHTTSLTNQLAYLKSRTYTFEIIPQGTNHVDTTKHIWMYPWVASGTIVAAKAWVTTALTGDSTMSVAFERSAGGAAFAAIGGLSFAMSSATTALTVQSDTATANTLATNDIIRVVADFTVGTGAAGTGLSVALVVTEDMTGG